MLPVPLTKEKVTVSLGSGSVADKVPTVEPEAWFSAMLAEDKRMEVGASLVAVTLTVLVAGELPSVPSFTIHVMVRSVVVGSSEVLEYVMALRAACHSDRVAVAPAEARESTPVPES